MCSGNRIIQENFTLLKLAADTTDYAEERYRCKVLTIPRLTPAHPPPRSFPTQTLRVRHCLGNIKIMGKNTREGALMQIARYRSEEGEVHQCGNSLFGRRGGCLNTGQFFTR